MIESYPINDKVPEKEILRIKEKFIKTGILEEGVIRPIIAASWKRCRKMGIDYERLNTSTILPEDKYKRLLAENAHLIEVAKPFMDNLHDILKRSNYTIVLISRDGYNLYMAGLSKEFPIPLKVELFKKICWQEKFVGTCPFSLAFQTKAAIQIIGAECYCREFIGFKSSHASIKDENGKILAVLGITSWDAEFYPHTLGVIIAAVTSIEYHLKHKKTLNQVYFYNEKLKAAINSMTDSLIFTNKKREILEINQAGEELLGLKEEEVKFKDLDSIVRAKPAFKELTGIFSRLSYGRSDEEVSIFTSAGIKKCIVSLTPVKDIKKDIIGWAISLKNIKRMRKLVKRMVTYQAQ
ncbi:MAG: PAS domain S-box protein, partial [Thermodesulfobacteriota bacterium]|nr:PAS domain S-box protein [Thermodesulfobacteriota bacterium]